jgi:membrane protease YdiL (CAAX protease family)
MSDRLGTALREELARVREALCSREALILCLSAALPAVMYYHRRLGLWPPQYDKFEWFLIAFVLFYAIPVGVIMLGFRERAEGYGLCLGEPRIWLRYLIPFAAAVIPVILIASRLGDFRAYYPQWPPARAGGWLLVAYEAGFAVYFLAWEFFFRGFVLFGLAKRWGSIAIVLQTVPFTLAHLGKPQAEVFSAIVAGLALGMMAYRGRSILPCVGLHWVCALTMDLAVIYW